MRTLSVLLAAALLPLAAGCIIEERGHYHGSAGVAVVCDHHFVYFPDWCAYRCTHCDEWWVLETGSWTRCASRPARFSLGVEVAFVDVDEHGPEPFVRFEEHRRRYPPGWKGDRDDDKGPPPGRGWRK
jgi:hypothetical protein